jgi:hypothetical protein
MAIKQKSVPRKPAVGNVQEIIKPTNAVLTIRRKYVLCAKDHTKHGITAVLEGRKKWKGWKYSGPHCLHTFYARTPTTMPTTDQLT